MEMTGEAHIKPVNDKQEQIRLNSNTHTLRWWINITIIRLLLMLQVMNNIHPNPTHTHTHTPRVLLLTYCGNVAIVWQNVQTHCLQQDNIYEILFYAKGKQCSRYVRIASSMCVCQYLRRIWVSSSLLLFVLFPYADDTVGSIVSRLSYLYYSHRGILMNLLIQ